MRPFQLKEPLIAIRVFCLSGKNLMEKQRTSTPIALSVTHLTHINVFRNRTLDCARWVYKICAEAKRAANAASLKCAYSIQGMTP
jgi:hypothetical protein